MNTDLNFFELALTFFLFFGSLSAKFSDHKVKVSLNNFDGKFLPNATIVLNIIHRIHFWSEKQFA